MKSPIAHQEGSTLLYINNVAVEWRGFQPKFSVITWQLSMDTWLQPDATVNHRYQILRQLGQGKLGRTYLAEDRHRFKEPCILQEFAPDVHDPHALQKTEELFQRKAQVLYSLEHPQIPRFRELFPFKHQEKISLFLVQDYVQGLTYRQLLNERLSRGKVFSEEEVTQFLLDILPVLIYLHGKGIIHRDLTPDNILCRDPDQLPILIDFGSVKQLSAIATTYFKQPQLLTAKILQIGQPGYAPQEQINQGIVSASSDLYGLAATALVLLTGQEPLELIDPHTSLWPWPSELSLSDSLTHILQKMLAEAPGDRYDSAQGVIDALNDLTPQPTTPATVVVNSTATPVIISQISHQEISNQPTSETKNNMTLTSSKNSLIPGCLGKLVLILSLIIGSGMIGWWAGKVWLSQILTVQKNPEQISVFSDEESTTKISDQELQRKTELRTRRRELGLDQSWFVNLVDEMFNEQYPSEKGRILSNGKDDASWREKWDQTAANLLDTLEGLSSEAVQGMGNYSQNQLDSWKSQVNNLHLSSRALYDLVDGRFLSKFPEQINQDFWDKPLGQVWSAMVLDTLTALQSGTIYEKLAFDSASPTIQREESLEVGAGKAYVLQLNATEKIEVNLEGDRNLLLSIYSPTGKNNLLEDSSEHQWSGELIESGYYEFTVVSKADKLVNYKLKITVPQEY